MNTEVGSPDCRDQTTPPNEEKYTMWDLIERRSNLGRTWNQALAMNLQMKGLR
jgi:hypothetical protein